MPNKLDELRAETERLMALHRAVEDYPETPGSYLIPPGFYEAVEARRAQLHSAFHHLIALQSLADAQSAELDLLRKKLAYADEVIDQRNSMWRTANAELLALAGKVAELERNAGRYQQRDNITSAMRAAGAVAMQKAQRHGVNPEKTAADVFQAMIDAAMTKGAQT